MLSVVGLSADSIAFTLALKITKTQPSEPHLRNHVMVNPFRRGSMTPHRHGLALSMKQKTIRERKDQLSKHTASQIIRGLYLPFWHKI